MVERRLVAAEERAEALYAEAMALAREVADRLTTCDEERKALRRERQTLERRQAVLAGEVAKRAAAREAYEARRVELSKALAAGTLAAARTVPPPSPRATTGGS
jgi:hypothetical protein